MEFQSDRLLFREFEPEDYPLFSSVFSNERVMQYAYIQQITDESEMAAYFRRMLEDSRKTQNRKSFALAVCLPADKSFIGFADIEVKFHEARAKYGEIGYFLLPEHWGKGYATEIAKRLTGICFRELQLHKVVASCNANNLSSENVMRKAGMHREGQLRKERFKNGRWDDELRYGLLKEEWEGMPSHK